MSNMRTKPSEPSALQMRAMGETRLKLVQGIKMASIGLGRRAINILEQQGLDLDRLVKMTDAELASIKGLGATSIASIKAYKSKQSTPEPLRSIGRQPPEKQMGAA